MKKTISRNIKRSVNGWLAGSCLALVLAVPAFAEEPGQVAPQAGAAVVIGMEAGNAGGGVSGSYGGGGIDGYASEALRDKHREVDEFLFKQHNGSFPERGFTVTHTGPVGDRIEIGIYPYEEADAEFLLEVFGDELVSVVEGVQAIPLIAVEEPAAPDAVTGGTVVDGDTPVSSTADISGAVSAEDMPARTLSGAGDAREIATATDVALSAEQDAALQKDQLSGVETALYALAAAAAALIAFTAVRKLRKR
jgi:hypothetical protein